MVSEASALGSRTREKGRPAVVTPCRTLWVLLRSLDFILRTTVYFKCEVTRFHLCFAKSILAAVVRSMASRGL